MERQGESDTLVVKPSVEKCSVKHLLMPLVGHHGWLACDLL